jgi:PTS system mannose-specific IIA component
MIQILIITHGDVGVKMFESAQSIVGHQEDVVTLSLSTHESLAVLSEKIKDILKIADTKDGTLIITDMLGGTPCNASLPLCSDYNIEIISGMNLYMLISVFANRNNMNLRELANKTISDGQKNIANIRQLLMDKMRVF